VPAEHLRQLDENFSSARKIVSRVPPNECSTELQGLCLQSYIFLTHAAIEAYFEDVGSYAARRAVQRYNQEGVITKALVGLVSSKIMDEIGDRARKKIAGDLASNIGAFASAALSLYIVRVQSNNGIKKENVHNLLVPVGVEPENEDIFALNELHSFGTHRGAIAHQFAAIRTEHTLSSVDTSLRTIRGGISTFDAAVEAALA
jgi:hypothetical protein